MKAVLICPGERPAVAALAQRAPLALMPILGKALLEYWLDHLVDRGVREVRLLASDRPEQIRAWLGDGVRWELKVEMIPEDRELTPDEARARYRVNEGAGWPAQPDDVIVMDSLPGAMDRPLFASYADFFSAVRCWLPKAASAPDRLGVRTMKPDVWIGMHCRVSPDAELQPPCWIGENVLVGPRSVVGPGAVLENGTVVAADAEVTESIVGSETYVGEFTEVKHSVALGRALINWQNGSCTYVPDAFLLSPLDERVVRTGTGRWLGRATAVAVMLLTLPCAFYAVLMAWLRGARSLRALAAVRPSPASSSTAVEVLTYHEFTAVAGWLKRWPQLWKVARGEFAWVGNRPLSPAAAVTLTSHFDRLWLKAPIGLISLADAEACAELLGQEARVLASFYAMRANWRLDLSILGRVLGFRVFKRISTDNRL